MLPATSPEQIELPDEQVSAQARDALTSVTAFLQAHSTPSTHVQLVSDDSSSQPTSVVVPSVAFRFFIDVLHELAEGNAVMVAPIHAMLTSQQAADLLNVSRPYLIKLLDNQEIPHQRVDNQRRIRLFDVIEYKKKGDATRRRIARDLTREAQEMRLGY